MREQISEHFPFKAFLVLFLLVIGKVQFEVRAEGGEDEGGMGVSSIKVNGVEHCPRKVGHNVVVLDPTGEVFAAKNFNTNAGEGPALGQFLDQLPEDHVVLVATQGVNGREQGKDCAQLCVRNFTLLRLSPTLEMTVGHWTSCKQIYERSG